MNVMSQNVLPRTADAPVGFANEKQGVVFIVSDNPERIDHLAPVCDFLDLQVYVIASECDLLTMLRMHRPLGIIADVDGTEQDGFNTMKVVARHNRALPILLLTEGDPALMGAADAVQELCGLHSVTLTSGFPAAGQIVNFLFAAGRSAGCMRLVPV